MKNLFYALLMSSAFFISCEEEDKTYECEITATNRIGARCVDGTTSNSTGSGTCSGHGGVEVWLCK